MFHAKKSLRPGLHLRPPVWEIALVLFAALCATHYALLTLPYYWDEAGYYIPAAWDLFRTGSLIPLSTVSNAHPPLPSLYLALWWKLLGFAPVVTRLAMLAVAALALAAVWRLSMRLVYAARVGFWVVALTALYPVWFAQSSLAHADLFAAACTLWGLAYGLPGRRVDARRAAVWFALAVLCKETAILAPLTLAAINFYEGWRAPGSGRRRLWRESLWLAACLPLLALWYGWHYLKTGFFFGNPEFLRYNAEATLEPARIGLALLHRIFHLTVHMDLFVPVGAGLASWLLAPRPYANGHARAELDNAPRRAILILLAVHAVAFSFLGGALLTRYLLSLYPLVLLLAVTALYRRVRYWQALMLLMAAAFTVGIFVDPPYRYAPEDNLAYARIVRLHQAGVAELARRRVGATVLTAWPMTDELRRPELGYVNEPYEVAPIESFSAPEIDRAAAAPERYSAALVFSTKYDPPPLAAALRQRSDRLDRRYFGMHSDLEPEAIARRLGGELLWRQEDGGWWIALVGFNRQLEARAGEEVSFAAANGSGATARTNP